MNRSLFTLRWQILHRWRRIRRAVAYAGGRLSEDDAQSIILDCRLPAGWYPLMTLSPDDVREMATGLYGDAVHALDPYLDGACECVARKWDHTGDEHWHAREWALDLALQGAAQDGIVLTLLDDTATPFTDGEDSNA
jgi:hypothetical protein